MYLRKDIRTVSYMYVRISKWGKEGLFRDDGPFHPLGVRPSVRNVPIAEIPVTRIQQYHEPKESVRTLVSQHRYPKTVVRNFYVCTKTDYIKNLTFFYIRKCFDLSRTYIYLVNCFFLVFLLLI